MPTQWNSGSPANCGVFFSGLFFKVIQNIRWWSWILRHSELKSYEPFVHPKNVLFQTHSLITIMPLMNMTPWLFTLGAYSGLSVSCLWSRRTITANKIGHAHTLTQSGNWALKNQESPQCLLSLNTEHQMKLDLLIITFWLLLKSNGVICAREKLLERVALSLQSGPQRAFPLLQNINFIFSADGHKGKSPPPPPPLGSCISITQLLITVQHKNTES